jgi:hypothetical protein
MDGGLLRRREGDEEEGQEREIKKDGIENNVDLALRLFK